MLEIHIGGVPEHFNLPWHLAIENDRFRAAGANVIFHDFPGGTGDLSRALDDGSLDMATLLFEGAISRILSGSKYRIVKVYVDSPLIWGIHISNSRKIDSVDDLCGGSYAISRFGSGSHLIAIVDAALRGWPTDNIKFVEVRDLEGARKALAAGNADMFFWEKYMTKPLVDNGEFRRIAERVVPWPAIVVAVRKEFLEMHTDVVRNVLSASNVACQEFACDPAAAQVIADRFQLGWSDSIQWLSRTRWNNDFLIPVESAFTVFENLQKLGIVKQAMVKVEDFWVQV